MTAVSIARFSIGGETVLPSPLDEAIIASIAKSTGGPITYRGYVIGAEQFGERSYCHEDDEPELDGEGVWIAPARSGHGSSIADCMAQIDAQIAEDRS